MKPSGIITLTTDFGLTDPYVAMMKGVILSINPAARIIDVTHLIGAGSISHAAALIQDTYSYFPEGTVHVAVVDPGVGSERRLLALEARSHLFVGPDNGVFWPVVMNDRSARLVHLTETKYFLPHVTRTFHGREIFAPVAAHLSVGVSLESLGVSIKDPVELFLPAPYQADNVLYGQIIRVDNFGNLITNIGTKILEDFLRAGNPRIEVGNLTIQKMSRIYSESDEGESLALINSSNLLEIAVNMGRASEYVSIDAGEIVGTQVKITRA
jgi:S-adenosyl-L-methionine hydrolase (adenosine-forming)